MTLHTTCAPFVRSLDTIQLPYFPKCCFLHRMEQYLVQLFYSMESEQLKSFYVEYARFPPVCISHFWVLHFSSVQKHARLFGTPFWVILNKAVQCWNHLSLMAPPVWQLVSCNHVLSGASCGSLWDKTGTQLFINIIIILYLMWTQGRQL